MKFLIFLLKISKFEMTKYIHAFSDPITDEIDQSLIGNKGYNLCLMRGMDLPIP